MERGGKLLLSPVGGGLTVEVRAFGESLVIDGRLVCGPRVSVDNDRISLGREWYERKPIEKPAPSPGRWDGLIGEYGWNHDVLYILENEGRLHALIEWFFDYPLQEDGPDRFSFPDYGLYAGEQVVFQRDGGGKATQAEAAGVVFVRRPLDGDDGQPFRIKPRRPVAELRAAALAARPPVEPKNFRTPELVELVKLDATIRLDIRYATDANFLGVPVYTTRPRFPSASRG